MSLSHTLPLALAALDHRGAGRLSGASLSRGRPSRHLDGRAGSPRWRSGSTGRRRTSPSRRARRRARAFPLSCPDRVGRLVRDAGSRAVGALGFAALAVLAASLPAQRSLDSHVRAVADGARPEASTRGGAAVSMIVGRNPDGARRGRRRARRDREPGREFLRRRRRAAVLDRARRARRRRALQGDQHRRQHDRPPERALRRVRLGGGAARRSRQPAGLAACRALARSLAAALAPGASARDAWRAVRARRAQAPLAQRRLAGGGDGRRAGAQARGAARLWRDAGRRRLHGRRPARGDGGRHPSRRCGSTGARAAIEIAVATRPRCRSSRPALCSAVEIEMALPDGRRARRASRSTVAS